MRDKTKAGDCLKPMPADTLDARQAALIVEKSHTLCVNRMISVVSKRNE